MDQSASPSASPHDIPHCSFAKLLNGLYKVQRNEQNCPLLAAEQIAGLSYLCYLSAAEAQRGKRDQKECRNFSGAYYLLPPQNGCKSDGLHLCHLY